jgi:hypothetical protein
VEFAHKTILAHATRDTLVVFAKDL